MICKALKGEGTQIMKKIEPNYRYFLEAMQNKKPERMPIYEHNIDRGFISKAIGQPMEELFNGTTEDKRKFFRYFVGFWEDCGYDTVSFELGIPLACPGSGCLRCHTAPVICEPEDVERYPWEQIPDWYFEQNAEYFELFTEEILRHDGLRGLGGPGYGIFETVQDLVSYTELCYLREDEPEMVETLFARVRELYEKIWTRFLRDYSQAYCVCRMGDDLGFDGQTLLPHDEIRKWIIPGYRRIVELSHAAGKPFVLHSCGKIFDILDDLIATGIDAKHSNEDKIAPFHEWVVRYGDRICNLGGIDMNILCLQTPEQIQKKVRATIEENIDFGGFGLGCGNSIPDYVPFEGFFAMNEAANTYRMEQMYGQH